MTAPSTVVFDLGGVLIDWDPRHLYRRLLPDDEIDDFLDEIGFAEWNHAQDAGGSWDEAVEALAARHPHRRELIAAYPRRYPETMAGPIEGTVRLLTQLRATGTRLLALTNWSAETFHHALSTFGFLEMFEDIVVSGVEGVAKPDPRLFTLLIERFALVPAETVFIDDSAANVAAAAELGLTALRFRDPDLLRADLRRLGLPVDA
ncbi:MAG: HAD family hydrolase [Actinomycetes bacterium]